MATKKHLSLEGLTEYDALIKATINEGDKSTLDSAKSYTDEQIAAISTSDVSGQISTHNVDAAAHADIREAVNSKADSEHTHDDLYYTQAEIDAMVFITVADIDAICNPNTITFTISGTEYIADKDMTWSEWAESDYNTIGLVCLANIVLNNDATAGLFYGPTRDDDTVLTTDIIVNNGTYYLVDEEIL